MKTTIKSNVLYSPRNERTRLVIVLDSSECYKDDPGQGTPAMVVLKSDESNWEMDSGTFYCAVEQGELSHQGTNLSQEQTDWLESKRQQVDDFISKYSV